jgi:hypothetical protein
LVLKDVATIIKAETEKGKKSTGKALKTIDKTVTNFEQRQIKRNHV